MYLCRVLSEIYRSAPLPTYMVHGRHDSGRLTMALSHAVEPMACPTLRFEPNAARWASGSRLDPGVSRARRRVAGGRSGEEKKALRTPRSVLPLLSPCVLPSRAGLAAGGNSPNGEQQPSRPTASHPSQRHYSRRTPIPTAITARPLTEARCGSEHGTQYVYSVHSRPMLGAPCYLSPYLLLLAAHNHPPAATTAARCHHIFLSSPQDVEVAAASTPYFSGKHGRGQAGLHGPPRVAAEPQARQTGGCSGKSHRT